MQLTAALEQLDGLEQLVLSADARAASAEVRRVLRRELGEAVDEWLRSGGGLRLEAPGEEARTVEPPAEEPPAEEPPVEEPPAEEPPAEELDEELTDEVAAVPLRAGALADLQAHFHTAAISETEPATSAWLPELRALVGRALPSDDARAELQRVRQAVSGSRGWARYPRPLQKLLLTNMAARLRALQEVGVGGDMHVLFSTLTGFINRHDPGFVHGLARAHAPRGESWSDDADAAWDEIVAYLPEVAEDTPEPDALLRRVAQLCAELAAAPDAARDAVRSQIISAARDCLQGGVSARDPRLVRLCRPLHDELEGREFRALRRAIRDAIADEVEDDQDDSGHALPDDWPWWHHTRGRRAMLVGGSPREPNRQRIEQTFRFAELTWERTLRKPQALQSLQTKILQRSVDLVIILGRFVGHSYDDILLPACREADVGWVHVDHGYGTVRIQQCIERFLATEDDTAAAR